MGELEHIILNTVRYFDILDIPVTATQVWQCLLIEKESGPRWGGHPHWTLSEVDHALQATVRSGRLATKWGYYFFPGREGLVREKLYRHRLSQQKWKIARRAARFLAAIPFVRGLAGSGSLALDNTKDDSDLDFLIFTAPGRIWTARLLLLAASQLLGRRRKHWDKRAPDMLCLNHYVSTSRLHLPVDLHNVYTAVQYSLLVPVYGASVIEEFQRANASWILQHVMLPATLSLRHQYAVSIGESVTWFKRLIESILLEPIGDAFERFAERLQRRLIVRHQAGRHGRVALSHTELAFHPDTKVPSLLARFEQDPGQKQLL